MNSHQYMFVSFLRVLINKQVYDEISVKETYDEESSSEKESGMASSYVTSSSSSSSERESDSPVPTSELSDSSFDYESSFSSYESSGNEDITWRIRYRSVGCKKKGRKRAILSEWKSTMKGDNN